MGNNDYVIGGSTIHSDRCTIHKHRNTFPPSQIECCCRIMTFRVGPFVKLQGLANATHYNGMTGVVVGNMSKEGRYPVQLLDHLASWDENVPDPSKECGGKILTAKRTNLVPSEDSEYWKIMGGSSIHELTVSTAIGFARRRFF